MYQISVMSLKYEGSSLQCILRGGCVRDELDHESIDLSGAELAEDVTNSDCTGFLIEN